MYAAARRPDFENFPSESDEVFISRENWNTFFLFFEKLGKNKTVTQYHKMSFGGTLRDSGGAVLNVILKESRAAIFGTHRPNCSV